MSKNPIINAGAAIVYIIIVSSVMFYGTKHSVGNDSLIAPISIISLFTLSAAVMVYLFGYGPFQLYLAGKKKKALNLFLQTVGTFGIITAIILILLFLKI